MTERAEGWPRRLAVVAAGAGGIALFFAAQKVVGALARGSPFDGTRILGVELFYWYLLAAFLPSILILARRVRIRRDRWIGPALVHSAGAVAIGLAHSVLYYGGLALALGAPGSAGAVLDRELPPAVMTVFWKYWVVVAVYYTFDFHRKYRERREHAATLERSLTEARLEALRMQLHPHFLFNTLHTVSMLNLEDPHAANRVLARLSDLLRVALDTAGKQEVPLAEEIDFARRYLEIEQVRFEGRLDVDIDVAPDLLDVHVPNLLLQPLVENAVRHGVGRAGRIRIAASRAEAMLVVRVSDDGGGVGGGDGPAVEREGIGLANTRERLASLYGLRWSLRLDEGALGGLCVEIAVPLHRSPLEIGPGRSETEGRGP